MLLKRPFYLGSLELPSNVFCAPLAGCSDYPFRKILSKYRPGLIYCEMVKMDALVRRNEATFRLLDFDPSMHPIGAQLCGSKPEIAAESARIIEDLGFAVLDLNCGCPVDKVTKDGSGSGLLKNPEKIGEILSNIVAAVKIPVTVKIRIGWDSHSIVAPEITRIAEEAGARAICIHARTRAQGYQGPAKWEYIKECVEEAQTIKVIGNGDIFDVKSAESILKETGCDAILVARGTMGQPWIIEDIIRALSGEPPLVRSGLYAKEVFQEHLDAIVSYQNEHRALLDLRRVGCWFLRNGRGVRELREAINRSTSLAQTRELVENYAWENIQLAPAFQESACDSASC